MFKAGLAPFGLATAKHNKNNGTPLFRSGKGFLDTPVKIVSRRLTKKRPIASKFVRLA
jgi:hypothetical protein